jgi:hypothetical protein
MQITDLVEKDLAGFTIKELTSVCYLDEDGRKGKSVGLFQDKDIANAFVRHQANPLRYATWRAFVLTNGKEGLDSMIFLVGPRVTLLDDEKVALETLIRAMTKLSSEEKAILGL